MADTARKTKNKNVQTSTGINVLIPTTLHKRLRIKCLNEGLSMPEAIEAAVKDWLR